MSVTTSTSAPLAVGFSTLGDEVSADRLESRGEFPGWLSGSLLRTGPALWDLEDQALRHWFDGLAMLHRFSFSDGRVSYANRFLHSAAYEAARQGGKIAFSEFATDPCRSLFKRVQSLFVGADPTDNGNVNVARLGERFLAMTETPMAVRFDPQTLETAGVAYRAPGTLSTAHPHIDRATGGLLNYAARLGPRSSYRFFVLGPRAGEPAVVASLPVSQPAYVHSFGLTERFMVLAEFPFVVKPLSLALARRPYIENYRWMPDLGTRFSLVDRGEGTVITGFETDPCFAFHHVNAFDQGDQVVVDVCSYPDASIIQSLYLDHLRAGGSLPMAHLTRFRLSLTDRSVTTEPLGQGGLELPRFNYQRCNERTYR
ncbi:MAG TPA: carotenoid oxygenase family protein, partial [Acidimicrobiales bacterium]|nr:carotenoid oxygenase family protein [Acidimicrobiales bacterium]